MTDISALIDRIESASGPDRDLDIAICQATDTNGYLIENDGTILVAGDMGEGPGWFNIGYEVPRFTASLDSAWSILPEGFWWRGGTCDVSSEATVCPDHNGPHRERLLRECPPAEDIWNEGIETELRPGSHYALIRALLASILKARQAMATTSIEPAKESA
jgi:hypothetical protein